MASEAQGEVVIEVDVDSKGLRGAGAEPRPPEARSSPFRGEFQKQSCGLFLEEGHFA